MHWRWLKLIVAKKDDVAGTAEAESGLRWFAWFRALLLVTAISSFGVFGYFAAYQLFFAELPIEDIAKYQQGGSRELFIYDGVAYFEGTRLHAEKRTQIHTGSIAVIDGTNKGIELYIRIDDAPIDGQGERSIGTLTARHRWNGEVIAEREIALTSHILQRHLIDWPTNHNADYTLDLRYVPAEESVGSSILVGSNIVGVRFRGRLILFAAIGSITLGLWLFAHGWRRNLQVAWFTAALALMTMLHSGAFISNEYFSDAQSSIGAMHRFMWQLFDTGEFERGEYRSLGYGLIPSLTIAIEGMHATEPLDRVKGVEDPHYFLRTFITSRYLMYLWFAITIGFLFGAVWRRIHPKVAILFGCLTAIFYPFALDLYNIADDAYAIPLFAVFLAGFIHYVYGGRRSWGPVFVVAIAMAFMLLSKITPAYLMLLAPLAVWAQRWQVRGLPWRKKLFDARSVAILAILVAAGAGSRSLGHIGGEIAPGQPYAKTVFWEIVWAANGRFDSYTAHWFTRRGTERSERVEQQTGLDAERSRFRHSQTAMDTMYKPQVLNALRKRPGFFWSMATQRAEQGGLSFFEYTVGGSARWEQWEKSGESSDESIIISGREVLPVHRDNELIRQGKYWKIAPLVVWTRFMQFRLPEGVDKLLILVALAGILLLRRWDMIVLLVGCGTAKILFSVFIHNPLRYTNFNNIALLLGLAVALYCAVRAVEIAGRRTFRRHLFLTQQQ